MNLDGLVKSPSNSTRRSGGSWGGAQNSPSSLFFLPLEGGGSEVGVKILPLTTTLSHGGERESDEKNDYVSPASQMVRRDFL
jgi:hypothetical protein